MIYSRDFKLLVEEIRAGFASVVAAMQVTNTGIGEIKAGINRVDAGIDGVNARLDMMHGTLSGVHGTVKETNARVIRLGEVIEGTNGTLNAVCDYCVRIDSKADKLMDGIDRIHARLDSTE